MPFDQVQHGVTNIQIRKWKDGEQEKKEQTEDVLDVVIGPGLASTHFRDNKPQRARPPPNGTWPGLHPGSPAIEVRASEAHLALILLVFNFASVCEEGNKQSSGPTLIPYSCSPPQGLKSILTRIGREHISVYRYRTYIEVRFQSSPHRVDDRGYFKEKRQGGVFKSEEDIKKIHRRGKKHPSGRNNFLPFQGEKYVRLCGRLGW